MQKYRLCKIVGSQCRGGVLPPGAWVSALGTPARGRRRLGEARETLGVGMMLLGGSSIIVSESHFFLFIVSPLVPLLCIPLFCFITFCLYFRDYTQYCPKPVYFLSSSSLCFTILLNLFSSFHFANFCLVAVVVTLSSLLLNGLLLFFHLFQKMQLFRISQEKLCH